MVRFRFPAILAIAFVLMAGCSTKSRVTEEDRVVLDYSVQIGRLQRAHLEVMAAVYTADPARAAAALKELRELTDDAIANAEQLQKNWGAPKESTAYTPANADGARKASDKSHSAGFWSGLAAGALSVGLFLVGVARSPLAKMIPGVGTALNALDGFMAGAETWMQKMKDADKPELAEGLAGVLDVAIKSPWVKAYADKRLVKIQSGTVAAPPETQVATALAADAAVESVAPASPTTPPPV